MYATDRHTQAVVTLEIRNSSLNHLDATHFLTLRHPCLGFDSYFVNHWARLTKQPLCLLGCSNKFFFILVQSRSDSQL